MTKAQYTVVALCLTFGIGLIVLGTTHPAGVIVWDLPLQARVVKVIGLLTILASLVGFFALYGASLPPTRYEVERRTGRDEHEATEEAIRPYAANGTAQTSHHGIDHGASQPVVSLTRTSTKARLFLASERKK